MILKENSYQLPVDSIAYKIYKSPDIKALNIELIYKRDDQTYHVREIISEGHISAFMRVGYEYLVVTMVGLVRKLIDNCKEQPGLFINTHHPVFIQFITDIQKDLFDVLKCL